MVLLKGREIVFKSFKSGIFLKLKQSEQLEQSKQSEKSSSDHRYTSSKSNNNLITLSKASSDSDILLYTPEKVTGLKIFTPKQMSQRLPIALAQVKARNNSENLLNELRQIVYSLYQLKEITKNVYNNIIKSIQTSNGLRK